MYKRFLPASSVLFFALLGKSEEVKLEPVFELDSFVVSAGPLGRSAADFALPVVVLDADVLKSATGNNLGDVLNWQPGVGQSSFSAGASRPILRGFDGPRVQLLNSGLEAIDVSSTSPDHGVAMETLLSERIEIIRGPATLLYGSSAIGGVINVIGREMARERTGSTYSGGVRYFHESVSRGDTFMGYTQIEAGDWAINLTGLQRRNEDYHIPSFAESIHTTRPDSDSEEGILENSFSASDQYSIGVTRYLKEEDRVGFAVSSLNSQYGVPGHEHHDEADAGMEHEADEEGGVSIDLNRKRYALEWELYGFFSWIETVRVRFDYTDYDHAEYEGNEIGTVFRRDGWELRVESGHAKWWVFDEGAAGLQWNDSDFAAEGDEAFTPSSRTRNEAFFLNEHIYFGRFQMELGGRFELQDIFAETSGQNYTGSALSYALSGIWKVDTAGKSRISLSIQRSQRHPTATELYADGPHLATHQYEIGDSTLGLETAYGVDLGFSHFSENWEVSVSLFYMDFDHYIQAEATGQTRDELEIFQFRNVDALFQGGELEWMYRVYRSMDGKSGINLSLMGDWVEAKNDETGAHLPRIPPLRVGSRIELQYGKIDFGITLRHAFAPANLAPGETTTPAYTELSLDLFWRIEWLKGEDVAFFIKGANLLNETIRNHSSYLKEIAPLPGRNLTMGMQLMF